MVENRNLYKLIPKVDQLLEDVSIKGLMEAMPRKLVVDSIREEIDLLRENIGRASLDKARVMESVDKIAELIVDRAKKKNSHKLRRLVNATGTVIHTNIGRSLIDDGIMDNVREIASNYSNLEFDLDEGIRGSRYSHLEDILVEITGGEAAMVVNNNAAAVLLVLSTMAKGGQVIVSRGELIEIGGSFRIPDVMEQSGAHLISVGTTNKTHPKDYEAAITEDTKALLKVHTSNYRILGFTSSVSIEELDDLGSRYDLPVIEDLGSGVLVDLSKYGLEYEPTVQDSIRKGVDVVTFSGDKLLGGPQAGIIVGKKEYIEAMKRNPLTRAFRVDKFTISALEATLRLYIDETQAIKRIPTLRMLCMPIEEIEEKAIRLYKMLEEELDDRSCSIELVDDYSEVGGGSLPLEKLPTKCIMITLKDRSISRFERKLRRQDIPIIVRVYRDNIYLDLRTIKEEEYRIVVDGIVHSLNEAEGCIR